MKRPSNFQLHQLEVSKGDSQAFVDALIATHHLLTKTGRGVSLKDVNLSHINIEGIGIQQFTIVRTIQTEDGYANQNVVCTYTFKRANFEHGHFTDCMVGRVGLALASFRSAVFIRCRFDNVNLEGAVFDGSTFIDCTFTSNNMKNASFRNVKAEYTEAFRLQGHHAFINNNMDGIDLRGADLGDVAVQELLARKWSAKSRPQLLGFQISTQMINAAGHQAKKITDNWEVIVGKDRAKEEYQRILGCLSKISNNYHLLEPADINALHSTRFLKKPLAEFAKQHDVVLKALQRQVVYRYMVIRLFSLVSGGSGRMPKDLRQMIFDLVGGILPDKPFLNKKMMEKQRQSELQNK